MDKASARLKTIVALHTVVFDMCFMRGAKASYTLSAQTADGVWVYVDIEEGDRGSPVAIMLIHRSDAPAPKYVEVPPADPEPLYEGLAKLAARVIELDRDGALPKLFVGRLGCGKTAVQRVALPMPGIVRWRPE